MPFPEWEPALASLWGRWNLCPLPAGWSHLAPAWLAGGGGLTRSWLIGTPCLPALTGKQLESSSVFNGYPALRSTARRNSTQSLAAGGHTGYFQFVLFFLVTNNTVINFLVCIASVILGQIFIDLYLLTFSPYPLQGQRLLMMVGAVCMTKSEGLRMRRELHSNVRFFFFLATFHIEITCNFIARI